jgi:hypothetical protein
MKFITKIIKYKEQYTNLFGCAPRYFVFPNEFNLTPEDYDEYLKYVCVSSFCTDEDRKEYIFGMEVIR